MVVGGGKELPWGRKGGGARECQKKPSVARMREKTPLG